MGDPEKDRRLKVQGNKMTNTKKLRGVARRVKGLFRAPKTNVTIKEHPELYHRHVWLEKPDYEVVDFLAKEHGLSKKQALHDLLDLGMGRYIGELVAQQNRQVIEHRARGEPARPTYFTIKLRQWARQKGYEISKFI